jgi:hypothetical protein
MLTNIGLTIELDRNIEARQRIGATNKIDDISLKHH